MPYRVIQWGAGNVGRHSLRAIIERDDLDLVGLRVYSPDKVGCDAGVFVGKQPTGVVATDDVEAILGLEADVVNYNALGMTRDADQAVDDIAMLLVAGFDVVSSATGMVHPKVATARNRDKLAAACVAGGTTFFESGENPGFTVDVLPITLTRMSRLIDSIVITEIADISRANRPSGNTFMGFGLPPGPCGLDDMHRQPDTSPFWWSLLMIADAVGFELDDVRYERESFVSDKPVECAMGILEPGTVVVQHIAYVASFAGRDRLIMNFIWRMCDDVQPDWPTGDRWLVDVKGDPKMSMELEVSTNFDARRPVSIMVSMGPLNAIPTVCDAGPGLMSPLDLPLFGGGYLTQRPATNADTAIRSSLGRN